jgi:hypothetical protein
MRRVGGAVAGAVGKVNKVGPPRMVRPREEGTTSLNPKRIVKEKLPEADDQEEDSDSDSDSGSESDSSSSATSAAPATPPVTEVATASYGMCPICDQPWANPALLSTGYVGCYLCLYDAVKANGKCPVTGMELIGGVDDIRKVLP